MRYHFQRRSTLPLFNLTISYKCNHPVYTTCSLFRFSNDEKGLAIIQQRYDPVSKHTWWGEIDEWLAPEIYLSKKFRDYYLLKADIPVNGLYPTVTVRQAMWALKMKPLPKKSWETVFDRPSI